MVREKLKRAVLLSSLALALAGCSEPAGWEDMVRTDDRTGREYVFSMPLSDSLTYDVDLYALMDCNNLEFKSFRGMRLGMEWTSPSGGLYSEEVWLDRSALAESRYHWKSFKTNYRSGIVPVESGTWSLVIRADEDAIRRYKISAFGVEIK